MKTSRHTCSILWKTAISALALCISFTAASQQNVGFRQEALTSPVINSDNTVTFLVHAPMAKEVQVFGDWEADNGYGKLEKDAEGIWKFTTVPLPSEMYTYRIMIDGVMGLDPSNPFTRRDVGNNFSIFY